MNNVVKNSKTSPKKSVTAKQQAKSNLTKRKNPDWDNLDRGYRYLTQDMKLPHDQAVAVMGNVVEESQGDYKAAQKNGGGRGLIQWDGRKAPSGRYSQWGSIWASVAKPANVYDSTTDTVKNYWAPWGGLKGDKVRQKFIKAPLKEKARIYAESYLRPGKPRIADRQLSTMQLDSIYNPRIKDVIVQKDGGQIRKMQTAAGGPLNLSPQDIKRGANLVGEYFLRGLGTFGKIVTAPFTQQGPTSATIYKSKDQLAKERTIDQKSEEQLGKAMTWVSPLNYGTALATGNGLNARKGEEEVASWSPAWQAVGRLGELYAGPKVVKGVKAAPRVVVNTAAKAGVKPAKAAVVAREIKQGIKQNTKNGRIEVTGNYFNSPDKWYRITETPEKYGIMEQGKNVTTHDASQTNGTINGWRSSMLRAPITKSSEGFIKRPHKIELNIRRKNGQAHGNTSQAAKGKLWGGTTSGSNLFPEGIIEGQAPSMINYGIDRTNFVITPWEQIPNGGRVGFHTGEMPLSNLGWFQRTNKGTYTYEPIVPEKRINFTPTKLQEPSKISSTIQISPEELYKVLKDQEQNGYYFMGHGTGRTGVNPQTIFDNGLRVKGGDIGNTTMPISESNLTSWPHMNSEEIILMPGKATMTKYDSAHGHIPSDWYSSDVFHWTDNPKKVGSGPFAAFEPNASFTEQTIGGVPGVYTKPEAVLGSYNTKTHTLKLNPKSQYEFQFNVPKLAEPSTSLKFFERNPTNIVKTIQDNGKIRLSLPSHTNSNPRQFVLEPQGNNKFYVHMRTWDGDHIPANLTNAEKQQLFNALYNELPEGAEILFPKSGPGNYGTRGTVAGLQRLSRDPRFTPGTKGTLQYLDKDGKTIKTYEGTSFIKASKLQYQKQGGKMNILEFLKNGSGIHIKKENRGKFTSYCGGKVTSECIAKGKNSSNPAIRKRATFADNARHFKHRLGGSIVEAFKLRRQILNSLNNIIND